MRFNHIKQPNGTTCGPACLAILSGRSIAEAIAAVFPEPPSDGYYTDWDDLRGAMPKLGLEPTGMARKTAKWDNVTSIAVVQLRTSTEDVTHFVVFDPFDGTVYDPLKEKPSNDRRMKRPLVSYLPVRQAR